MISSSEALSVEIVVVWFLEEVSLIDGVSEVQMFIISVLNPKLSFLAVMLNCILLFLRLMLYLYSLFFLLSHNLLDLADDAFWSWPFQRFQFGENFLSAKVDLEGSNLRKIDELIVIISVVDIRRAIG